MRQRNTKRALGALGAAFVLLVAACGDDDTTDEPSDSSSTTEVTEDTTDVTEDGAGDDMGDDMGDDGGDAVDMSATYTSLQAPAAAITVDGDAGDWADIDGLELTLEAISGEDAPEPKDAVVKVAHDDDNIYVLLQVDDDYNWDAEDAHLSASSAVLFAIDQTAASAMGATDEDRETSLGMVDIWHWELECAAGEQSGGVSGPGDGDGGNDSGCNLDDEYSTSPEEREDDNTDTAENSLVGVWSHSAPEVDADGTWTFELSRPLDTGDATDAQFAVGETAKMGVAYWDPDTSPEGWDDDYHVTSANKGFIGVELVG